MKEKFLSLIRSWLVLFRVLLDPMFLIPFGIAVLLVLISFGQTDKHVAAVLIFLISLSTGIAGGAATKIWLDHFEEKLTETKGKSAIRDLRLLFFAIIRIRLRIESNRNELDENDEKNKLMISQLQVYADRCFDLSEAVANAIENWADILEEANITDQLNEMKRLQGKIEENVSEKNRLKDELSRVKEDKEEERERLQKIITKKEEEIESLKSKEEKIVSPLFSMSDKGVSASSATISVEHMLKLQSFGSTIENSEKPSGYEIVFGQNEERKCIKCGKKLPNTAISYLQPSSYRDSLCDDCKRKT